MIVPKANAREAAVVGGIDVYGVDNLVQVVDFLDVYKRQIGHNLGLFLNTRMEYGR